MKLSEYLSALSADEKRAFADRSDTKVIYLIQIAGGHSSPSSRMALRISQGSGWVVTPHELRPDLYPNPLDGVPLTLEPKHPMRRHDDRAKTA